MTFEELITQSINSCIEEDAKAEYMEGDDAVTVKIRSIAEGIEKIYLENDALWDIDTRSRFLITDVIETGKGAPGIGYNSFSEMAGKLFIVKTVYMLNRELMKYQDRLTVYSYEYAADQFRFKSYAKACEGLLYVLESKNEDKEHALLFTKDAVTFAKFKKNGSFQISEKLRVPFSELIGVCPGYYSEENNEQIDIVLGSEDAATWNYRAFEIGSIDDDIICEILDSIICNRNNLNSDDDIAAYYADRCRREYNTTPNLTEITLADYWKIIIVLGEKAFDFNETFCKDILLATYQKQKSRARLDNNIALESMSRRRILALTDSLEEDEHRRIKITKKRQIIIPERLYDLMKFGDEAEFIYESGRLFLSPVVLETADKESEMLLEELVSMGLQGDELIQYFKMGIIPEAEGAVGADMGDGMVVPVLKAEESAEPKEEKKSRRLRRKKDDEDDIIY